jgi:hypothetical protein
MKRNAIIPLLSLVCIFCGCAPNAPQPPCVRERFATPVWVDSLDGKKVEAFTANSISTSKPIFMGIYDFGDTVFVSKKAEFLTNANRYVDSFHKNRTYFEQFSSDGLELIVDTINLAKFDSERKTGVYTPIYIVNSTFTRKVIMGKDYEFKGLQEAGVKKEHGYFYPIEGEVNIGCGCCAMVAELKPKQFAVILVKKYKGKFKTQLRTRLKIGENLYVTQPYTGYIDTTQFYFSPISFVNKKIAEKNKSLSLDYFFYGSTPLEIERERWK